MRLLRWWLVEGIPERLHRFLFSVNPWAQLRQARTEAAAWKRWYEEAVSQSSHEHAERRATVARLRWRIRGARGLWGLVSWRLIAAILDEEAVA